MLETLLLLFGYQFAGELIVRSLVVPVPGAVVGMLLLFVTLCLRKGIPEILRENVPQLMTHMSLMFIPAGAGVLAFWPMLSQRPLAMIAVLVLATLSTLLIAALSLSLFLRLQGKRN